MIKGFINRLSEDDKQTLSRFYLYADVNTIFKSVVLELADKDNQRRISRIDPGEYICELRYSDKYKWHFHVKDVKDRTLILIHFGNYHRDTKGCIILGNEFADIDGDGYRDVTSSKKTIRRLMAAAPKSFKLIIN